MLLSIIEIVSPIFLIVALGYGYARKYRTDMSVANQLTINIFVPALLFSVLIDETFKPSEHIDLAIAAIMVILVSGILAWMFSKLAKFDIKTFVPPMMYANSGNIGLPLALLAFGESAMPIAITLFMIENTLHFTLGVKTINRNSSIIGVLRIPMVSISLLAIILNLLTYKPSELLLMPLEMLGNIAIPLMLFSLGIRLKDINFQDWKIGLTGAIFKPLSGIVAAILILPWFEFNALSYAMIVIFAILPPAVLNFMVAEKYQQDPKAVASIVLIGNLFAVITIPIALYFLLPSI